MANENISENTVIAERHEPKYDSKSLNREMERAITDEDFLDSCMNLLRNMKFPAFKADIVSYIKKATNDDDVISLSEILDGYIEFKDQYHVRKAIEENDPKKKTANQITNGTRNNPIRRTTIYSPGSGSIKRPQAVNESEERKDFPEVSPTAMSDFICKKCGKTYQTPDDLAKHKRFEDGEGQERKISEKSRLDRQQTTPMSPGAAQQTQSNIVENSSNKTLNIEAAAKMANLLEGLYFPATKDQIISHMKENISKAKRSTSADILDLVQTRLQNGVKYNNTYEIEQATKLVNN